MFISFYFLLCYFQREMGKKNNKKTIWIKAILKILCCCERETGFEGGGFWMEETYGVKRRRKMT